MCIDYRAINARTVRDAFPLLCSEVIDLLGEAKVFSSLYLSQKLPEIIDKTAFSIFGAHYKFTKLLFGLVNGIDIFQRLMHQTMEDFIPDIMLVYLDDILIDAKDFDEHLDKIGESATAYLRDWVKIEP